MYHKIIIIFERIFLKGILILSLLFMFSHFVPLIAQSNPPPVLTLDAGNGIKAEFSNYSLTDYSVANGTYSGKFCFTLKNTPQRLPSQRPIFIVGIGFIYNLSVPTYGLINHSVQGNFVEDNNFTGVLSDGVYIYLASNGASANIPNPENGISLNNTASFCMTLSSNNPFTLNNLISNFAVIFSDGTPAGAAFVGRRDNLNSYIGLTINSLSDDKMCFSARNNKSNRVTGIGFDLPGQRDLFTLDLITQPQPGNQNFHFTTSPYRLRYFDGNRNGKLDFGILTGQLFAKGLPQLGLPPFSLSGSNSAIFCISGNFSGLKPVDILNSATVRFENDWGIIDPLADICPVCFGRGLPGTVATNPR